MTRRLVLPALGLVLTAALSVILWPDPQADRLDDAALEARQQRVAQVRAALAAAPGDPDKRLPIRAVHDGQRGLPLPTENLLPDDAERTQKARRKEWMAQRHRTAPGVDWKAIERANGKAQVARRNQLARQAIAAPTAPGSWVERGSDNLAGRMHAARVSSDGSTLVAGSSLGGVWTLDLSDESSSWQPIGDDLYGGSHWLAITEDEGAVDAIVSATSWGYVTTTVDRGVTWDQASLADSPNEIRRLVTTSDGSETVFLVSRSDFGTLVQRSTDGGATFEEVADLGLFKGDVWVPRDGGSRVYVAAADELWISDDLGDSWTVAGSFPGGGEANLTGSEAGAPTLYAIVDDVDLWRSDDAGATWVQTRPVADFWGRMAASMVDPQLISWGGFELYASRDGGDSHNRVNDWTEYYSRPEDRLHADIMGLEVVPDGKGGETWLIGTDGGLYQSRDALLEVDNLSMRGLRVSQYYSTHTHIDDAEQIAAGAQDQGYQLSRSTSQAGLVDFEQVISGDYAHLVSGDGTHDFVYSVYPGFILVQVGNDGAVQHYLDYPSGESGQYFAWLPPLTADPDEPTTFYFCGTQLWRYTWDGSSWEAELHSDEDFQRDAYEFLSAFSFAPSDHERAYAATSWGRLLASDDGGVTWEESDDDGPYSHYFHGTALLVDADDPDTAWVGGSGYGVPSVYMSTDGGDSWQDWSDGLPDTLVYDLAMATDGSRRVFAGTETAAYVRGPNDDGWQDITAPDAPVTIYWSVEALGSESTMRFGTYGRGIWDYQYIEAPLPPDETWADDTGDGDRPATPSDPSDPDGCGCGGAGPVGLYLLLPAFAAWVRRRAT